MNKPIFLIIIFLITHSGISYAVQKSQKDAVRLHIEKIIKPYMERYKVPGVAVALYMHGKPYLFHFGYADSVNKIPVTQKTLFEIGSISKIFTCLLLAQEVIDSHMKLSDPISMYIPQLATNKKLKTVTLEKLATHTSTLPFDAPDRVKTKEDLIAYMVKWQPSMLHPVWWKYSNHGIEFIRIALEEFTGKTFNELLIDRILKPLGMSATGIIVPEEYKKHCACCYDKKGNPTILWDHQFLLGSAAMRVSSADMLNFLKAAIGLPGVPSSIKKAMHITQTPYIKVDDIAHGLAWEISDLDNIQFFDALQGLEAQKVDSGKRIFDSNKLYEKGGTTNGFHSYLGVIPSQKSGIIIMSNRRLPDGWKIQKKIGREILLIARRWILKSSSEHVLLI